MDPKDLSLVLFLSGYLYHTTFKSIHYPTPTNVLNIVFAVSLCILILNLVAFRSCSSTNNFLLLVTSFIASSGTGFFTSLLIHRLWLSPINLFPGPPLARLTKLWGWRTNSKGNYGQIIKSLFDEYETDVLRVGPNELMIRNVEAVKAIYGSSEYSLSSIVR
jgi:hypothetical protein